ncbi:MAG: hypothetical protein V2A74_10360 [bacterium]
MKRTMMGSGAMLVCLMLAGTCLGDQAEKAASTDNLPVVNQYVLKMIETYPTDGTHTYWWPRKGESSYDGATTDVLYMGQCVMKGEPQGRTYCCGLTLEVFFRAMEAYNKDHGIKQIGSLTPEESGKFKHLWFCPESKSPGPNLALNEFKLGKRVENYEDARPGDFVQIWRNSGTGHSVIFMGWVRDDKGEITGMKYWSTQPKTNGIGYAEESFGGEKGLDRATTIISRPQEPNSGGN